MLKIGIQLAYHKYTKISLKIARSPSRLPCYWFKKIAWFEKAEKQPRKQEQCVISGELYKDLVERVLGITFLKYDDYQVIGQVIGLWEG